MTCEKSCEARAYQLVICQQHQALLAAADALETAASDISWFGPASEHGWEEDAEAARNAAKKARSVAMSGAQPDAS